MKVRVTVMLKDGVLDPQGKAIGHALHTLGFGNARDVRVGKVIELDLQDCTAEEARKTAEDMAKNLLANLVIEDYAIEVPA
ncbi:MULTISPECIES: phosphoribosylformylglycinamidine synthase subunit PurS [Acetobacter]|jgi:phosphoribosylformylglycinamidine synthase|uniref:Phosphoribosylformylglycinamidine synthase subunit PurS n=1 Tax=Acetobacter peroxydans TaxID=104098 RepID=A0A4Y3TNL3_9PROT|nr:phosphoribosylformylglycinamidine synthase subunit PurS [Acetobacter peroxydans]MCH4142705.1 phosphoribosylformylglycinamidine synthase subunit PurS [Acetobacter peroxydans]MCI1395442.1 phosphoribosylformylglycinamidine synthase subunit PurS [Acetobacter peroxydans]MCI1411051.1 phosphoribosylformylglycinamidine synthase subunit PurS [Acetobacter peroxydans]MCI1440008.1 phosphoribosylformylglycinamidine synthase subunit PurS [Acetobacter peroxydans]MCI1566786.1 phosphoribosylformylglycinamid